MNYILGKFDKAESSNATHARDDDQIHAHKYFFVNLMIKGDYTLENFGKADGKNGEDWS